MRTRMIPPADLADRLYALPPERFIAARDEAVAEARRAGNRDRAAALAKLRRPTMAAWMVNLLALRRPDLTGELLDLAEQLRRAQRELRGPDLRELSERRRDLVGELTAQARRLAVAAGRSTRDSLPLAEVAATLTAALADAEVAVAVRSGRLLRAASYTGFGETPRPRLRLLAGGRSGSTVDSEAPPAGARGGAVSDPSVRPAGLADRTPTVDPGRPRPADRPMTRRENPAPRNDTPRELESARTRVAEAETALAEATAAEHDAAGAFQKTAAALADLREQHATAQLALTQAKLRRKGAERAMIAARRQLTTVRSRRPTGTGDGPGSRPAESAE